MMRLFVNALAASAGGGVTYIRNVLPYLAARPALHTIVSLTSDLRQQLAPCSNVEFVELNISSARRFWFEQSQLAKLIRNSRADVLLSTGNFALRKSPVPQVLLSRNSIYWSRDYYRDLLNRHEYRLWLDTRVRGLIAKRSLTWADETVAPSEAFAADLKNLTNAHVSPIHHGFDHAAFTQDVHELSSEVKSKLDSTDGCLKVLFVSHYNYFRNFETLFRALPLLRDLVAPHCVRLLLTTHLARGANPGMYKPEVASDLLKQLGISDMVVELGSIPYETLHTLYARADVYVSAAYTETFAHPLVEAMASGIPVVASDIPVHREICADAAQYFPTFSPQELAQVTANVLLQRDTASRMISEGRKQSQRFSWKSHVDQIIGLCESLLKHPQ
jgi:glycosyltransferase involved in cell wall biosynthesis